MWSATSRWLAFVALSLAVPASAWANAVVQSLRGEVQVGTSTQTLIAARESQRLAPGTTVSTGADAQVVLRFDDGSRVVLNQNTQFRIVDFMYDEQRPAADRSIFDLLRGAARFVTGAIGKRSQTAWQLRAPQATIGVRGTDFMVAIVNPLYVSVTQGAVALSNGAGTVAFGAGAIGSVAGSAALAAAIPASALPAAAASAFSSMSTVAVSALGGAAGGAAGAAAGTAGAAGGVGLGMGAAFGAAVAGVAAAAGGGGGGGAVSHFAVTHNPSP